MVGVDPITVFRTDHAKVRDYLLDLIDAVSRRDVAKAQEALTQLDKTVGPHFRWEEESLYPLCERFFGREYLEYLLGAHDRAIRRAKELAGVLGKGEITEEQAKTLPQIIRMDVLSHVIECEGVAIFAEKLGREELDKVAAAIEKARRENVPLLEWAEKIKDSERKKRGLRAKALV